jgi:regulatory protein
MSDDDEGRAQRAPRTRPKRPRKISAKYLENAAVYYLQRYSSTVAGLRKALIRKIDRSVREHGGTRAEHLPAVELLLQKLERSGLLNDQSFTLHKADSLRAAGKSTRVIALKLRQKGVPTALANTHIARVKADISDDEAARMHARKKRLGPFRREANPLSRKEFRQKDLAAMARAGFSYDVAKRIIDGDAD